MRQSSGAEYGVWFEVFGRDDAEVKTIWDGKEGCLRGNARYCLRVDGEIDRCLEDIL